MRDRDDSPAQVEVHDPDILAHARTVLDACRSPQEMQEVLLSAVARNEEWRGRQCINLLAPEAPTSPTVRALLSSEVGIRAATHSALFLERR
jgi:glycine hydroxymethyltransferase